MLGAARLTDAQLTAVDALRSCCMNARVHGVLSPIQQAEREDAISDWLDAHDLPADIARRLLRPPSQSTRSISLRRRSMVRHSKPCFVGRRPVRPVHALASEVQEAAMRISGLVAVNQGILAHGSGAALPNRSICQVS